jgi:hypothetical protein
MLSRALFPAALLSTVLLACGSSPSGTGGAGGTSPTTTASTGGTGGTASSPTPKVHRATAAACTGARPPGNGGLGDPADHCHADSECTMGTNGRCVSTIAQPSFCSYDACSADADCGAVTVCECLDPANFEANTCVHGNCRVDADCGAGGFCSPSAVTTSTSCLSDIAAGSIGYFCHQAADTCTDDADCAGSDSICLFSVPAMAWGCHALLCTG